MNLGLRPVAYYSIVNSKIENTSTKIDLTEPAYSVISLQQKVIHIPK